MTNEFPYNRKDERNKRYENFTVTNEWRMAQKQKDIEYFCICDCGKTKWIKGSYLRSNRGLKCCQGYKTHNKSKSSKYFFSSFLHTYKQNSKAKNKIFQICLYDLDFVYEKQEGKCYYTGIELTLPTCASHGNKNTRKTKKGDYNVSIDRIDSKLGYVPNNICLCTKEINIMKNIFSKQHFIHLCQQVVNYAALENTDSTSLTESVFALEVNESHSF